MVLNKLLQYYTILQSKLLLCSQPQSCSSHWKWAQSPHWAAESLSCQVVLTLGTAASHKLFGSWVQFTYKSYHIFCCAGFRLLKLWTQAPLRISVALKLWGLFPFGLSWRIWFHFWIVQTALQTQFCPPDTLWKVPALLDWNTFTIFKLGDFCLIRLEQKVCTTDSWWKSVALPDILQSLKSPA